MIGAGFKSVTQSGQLYKWKKIKSLLKLQGTLRDCRVISGFRMGFKLGKYEYRRWVYQKRPIRQIYALDHAYAAPNKHLAALMNRHECIILDSRVMGSDIIAAIGGFFVEFEKEPLESSSEYF